MFCQKCGTSLADTATACLACNSPILQAGAAVPGAVAAGVKAAAGSAFSALKSFAGDPVGRLPAAYEALGDERARRVGLAYGVVSLVGFLLGGYLLLPFRDGLFDFLGFGGVLKCVLFGVVPFGVTALASFALRTVLGGRGGTGCDLFVAGAALLPVSLAMPIVGLLGYENYAAMAVVTVFAACTGVLMLFAGFSRISKLSERAATLSVPLVVVLVFWLAKVLAASVLGGAGGGPEEYPEWPGLGGYGY
jgi:hypothetical protein